MDIQISSNFERFLWYLAFEIASDRAQEEHISMHQATQQVREWMDDVAVNKGLVVNPAVLGKAKHYFGSVRVHDGAVLETIRRFHDFKAPSEAVTIDPHTAIGVKAAEVYRKLNSHANSQPDQVTVCLATAHPGKFLTAVHHALSAPDPHFEDTPSIALQPDLERKILQDAVDGKALFEIPRAFIGILDRPKRCLRSGRAPEDIKRLVESTLDGRKGQ
jgi:threonine synthase